MLLIQEPKRKKSGALDNSMSGSKKVKMMAPMMESKRTTCPNTI
jgi:hypothetical protein